MALERMLVEQCAYFAIEAPENKGAPSTVLLALHGYGEMAEQFIRPFAHFTHKNILVVAPQAPHQFYTDYHPKKVGCSWLTLFQRDQSIADFCRSMEQLFQKVREMYPVDIERVFVLGFSQGVSMSYRLAVHSDIPVAGLIAWGGDLPPDVVPLLKKGARFPIMIVHGKTDRLVPIKKAEHAVQSLREMNYPVEHYFYDRGHIVLPPVVEQILAWIEKQVTQ